MNCCPWEQLHLGFNTPSWAGECSGDKSRSCDSDSTLSCFSGKALIQHKNRKLQSDLNRGVEKAVGWSEYDGVGPASVQVCCSFGPQVISSSPPVSFPSTHGLRSKQTHAAGSHRPLGTPHFTSETADSPAFRAERSGFVGKALGAEPWEVKWLSNICHSSSNEPKPDGTSLPPLVCLPHHLQLQLLCYIPANFSTASERHLYLQGC